MAKRSLPIAIQASVARTQLGSILTQVAETKARFIITKSGKPTAVILGATDFDDMPEELDPEFQETLKVAAKPRGERCQAVLVVQDNLGDNSP